MNIQVNLVISADPVLLAALQALAGGKSQTEAPKPAKAPKSANAETHIVKVGKGDEIVVKQDQEPAAVETTHTIESLRAIAIPISKAGKKDEIKAWLSANAETDSLANLQPKYFDAFHKYITSL